jgi:hypothetical protein
MRILNLFKRSSSEEPAMSQPFCGDCPDHEGCMTGYPCEVVKRVDKESRMTREERELAEMLAQAGLSPEEAVGRVWDVTEKAFGRGYEGATIDYLHPDFGHIWEPPLPDGEGGMTKGGEAWIARREGGSQGWSLGLRVGWQSGMAGEPSTARESQNPYDRDDYRE